MANQIAIAMNNARLYQEAQERIKESNQLTQLYLTQSWQKLRPRSCETVNFALGRRDRKTRAGCETKLISP